MVKISVIIPVYNAAPYLGECLDSVLAQSLRDIEIICVDDCSTDDSLSLLEKYAVSDTRIRVLGNKRNRDLSFSRNRGLKEACGEYVFFLDSDDALYDSGVLKELYTSAKEDNAELVSGRTVNWFPDGQEREYTIDTSIYPNQSIRRQSLLTCASFSRNVIACNKLLQRSFLLNNDILFDETLFKFEDNDFSCRVAVHAKTISYIAANTYKYRQRKGNDKSKMHTKGLEDALWKSHAAKNMVSAVRTAEPEVQRIYAHNIGDILRGAYRDFIRYGKDKDDEYFKDIMLSLRNVFADMPEIVFRALPMELQLAASPLRQGKYAEAWKMLYMYKRMRALYYVRYFFLVMKHQIRNLTR